MLRISVAGADVVLHPSGAALLSAEKTLLVADAHFGKAVSFRKLGVPVPSGTTTETLDELSGALEATSATRVVFLGDFLHSRRSHAAGTLGAIAKWRAEHADLALTLVRGNHDDRAGDPPAALGLRVVDEPLLEDGFALCHHPRSLPGRYVLAGHLHPCVSFGVRSWDHLRLPCFWFGDAVGVLPAFGAFTGMHAVRPAPEDRLFAVADNVVAAMPLAGERFAA